MPEVRPYVSGESVLAGGLPDANPGAFNTTGGLGQLAQGTESIAQVMSSIATKQAREEQRARDAQDAVWVGETVESTRRAWMDWLADPEHVSDPDISKKFLEHAKTTITGVSETAPSPRAGQAIRQSLANPLSRAYDEAMGLGRKAGLSRLGQSFDTRASTALSGFRAGGAVPDIQDAWQRLYADIDAHIGKLSPEAATGLKQKYEQDIIYAAIDENPEFARELIESSRLIDEKQRHALRRALTASIKQVTAEARYNFERVREDFRVKAELGKEFNTPDADAYTAIYGADEGKVRQAQDEEYIGVMRGVFNEYTSIQDKHPNIQSQHVANLAQAIETSSDALKVKKLADKVEESARLFNTDKVSWLYTNNDLVRRLNEKIMAATEAERGGLLGQRTDILLRFQGAAPSGTPTGDLGQYLNLAEHEKSVLTIDEAERFAAAVNSGAPSEGLRKLDELEILFPNEQHRVLALNDMVRLPKGNRGVRQEMQLALQNKGAWWLDSYLAAVNNKGDVARLTQQEQKSLGDMITADPRWLAFQRSMVGDNLQRANEIEGFKTGISAFAQAQILKGAEPKTAVKSAVDMLIGESLGFTDVNGRALVVPRQRRDKSARADDEIADLGRKLSMALAYVDPAKIDDARFQIPDTIKGVERAQIIRDHVTSTGFFQPLPDGQGASLYVVDAVGDVTQVRDKKGRAFKVYYDDLPQFTSESVIPTSTPTAVPTRAIMPMLPKKTYDLIQKSGSDLLGTTEFRSYWPIQPAWLKNE